MATWIEQYEQAPATEVRHVPPGRKRFTPDQTMVYPGAQDIDALVRAIPPGHTMARAALRQRLAEAHNADTTCPVTTAKMMHLVAERAIEQLEAGMAPEQVTPFWRAMDPKGSESRRLTRGADFVRAMREAEAAGATATPRPRSR